ncbi:MAG TPA: branched-chain amino acid aminotransferase [Rhizomicrobium sp.]|jgi:branched-chain amino acid aminotransferase|nr:branched-chain amino acid aminotransferase [Rhizomicrobium sp.]
MVGWNGWSKTWTFYEGEWHDGNVAIMGPRSHGSWLASTVFDGARAFEGVTPDIERHMQRVNASAEAMGLQPVVGHGQWMELVEAGLKKFDPKAELYIKPMYWAEKTGYATVMPDPDSTSWCFCLYELPMPGADAGQSITLSPFRRPTQETMPVDAKAACLYPNNARAVRDAKARGFDNALLCDMLGNVAELANSNVFMVKDGVVLTPAANGTFLNGITRQRVIALLRADGIEVQETRLTYRDFQQADEIFSAGNYGKVSPIAKIDDRALPLGKLYRRTRELYWDFAHSKTNVR